MKASRKFYSMVLSVVMMLSILPMSASAAVGGRWEGKFKSFDYIKQGSTGNYVSALQRYLMSFDNIAKAHLAYKNSAGQTVYMDGDYGNGTVAAVKHVQTQLGCTSDGEVGKNTWGKIELDLDRYQDNGIILKRDLYNPNYVYKIVDDPYDSGSSEMLCFFEGSNYGTLVVFAYA